ncbi:MAG TPA: PIN domain-containing protein [Candidatus Binatia bacterium]|nr:PIN domain-containing protein [Candidatus Binatia bacterium]
MKLYCDTNVYNRCFDEQSQLRIRLECTAIEGIYALAEAGRLELTWSFMLDYENSLNPHADRKEWVELLSRLCTDTIAPSPQILTLARRLMKLRKLKPRDAIHVACAQFAGCDFFITCDDVLIKRASRGDRRSVLQVPIVNPVEFIRSEGSRYGKG